MPLPSTNGGGWLIALFTSLAFALIGLVIPNLYKQINRPRAHNVPKLVNEFLARHQIAYITYFLALSFTADFIPQYSMIKKLVNLLIALTFCSYSVGVFLNVKQDKLFDKFHRTACVDTEACCYTISAPQLLRLIWFNLLTGLSLLAAAIFAAYKVA